MKTALIHELMKTLQSEMFDTEDLKSLSFYEGAFYVFAEHAKKGKLDKVLLHEYLSDFLSEEIRTDTLRGHNPEALAEIENLLKSLGTAKSQDEAKKAYTLISANNFGQFERRSIEHLLINWNEDTLPEEFSREGIKIIVTEFGNAYLTNAAGQFGTLNGYDVELLEKADWLEPTDSITFGIDPDDFDCRNRRELELLISAWNENKLPEQFSKNGIRLAKSPSYVLFLTNSENQIVRVTEDEEIKIWN